jgi:prepilin-type N-terminal cleavage/methylation domain-containing protein/prepilin-type processing-associated H-X9-DG protein
MRPTVGKRAFTLVELLVVIAIIGVLVGLLLPAVQAARESARRSQCGNNIKQVALGLLNYHDANRTLPPSATNSTVDTKARKGWSWMLFVLPYIEQGQLYDACMGQATSAMQNPSFMVPAVETLARAPIPPFICPTDTVPLLGPEAKFSEISSNTFACSKANYLANGGAANNYMTSLGGGTVNDQVAGSQGALRKVRGVAFKNFTDGLSKTFLIGEAGGVPSDATKAFLMPGIWPGAANEDAGQYEVVRYAVDKLNSGTEKAFGSFHSRGANFAMADGSVTFIDDGIQANPLANPALAGFDATPANVTTHLSRISNPSRGVWERLSTRADGLPIGAF